MSESPTSRCQNGRIFFTVRLRDARSDALVRHVDILRDCVRLCMKHWPFSIEAAVILPSQAHMIWQLPPDDPDHAKRWRMIQSSFANHMPMPDYVAPGRASATDKGVWDKRIWDHAIADARDFELHMHLIMTAPVTAGLVSRPGDWPHSSIHRRKPHAVSRPSMAQDVVAGVA